MWTVAIGYMFYFTFHLAFCTDLVKDVGLQRRSWCRIRGKDGRRFIGTINSQNPTTEFHDSI